MHVRSNSAKFAKFVFLTNMGNSMLLMKADLIRQYCWWKADVIAMDNITCFAKTFCTSLLIQVWFYMDAYKCKSALRCFRFLKALGKKWLWLPWKECVLSEVFFRFYPRFRDQIYTHFLIPSVSFSFSVGKKTRFLS